MSGVRVTDHVILRYLERAHGLDVEALRDAIGEACARGVECDAPSIKIAGARFLVRDGTVVTCIDVAGRPSFDLLCRFGRSQTR